MHVSGSEGVPASAADGGGGEMGEEDEGESTCRQRGSTGKMNRSLGGERSRAPDLCLDSGRAGTPAGHRGSTQRRGSDSAGSRVQQRKRTGAQRREGGFWRRQQEKKRRLMLGEVSSGNHSV